MKQSTERERIEVGAYSGKHPDTVGRYIRGLHVTASTRDVIESACLELGYEHVIEERARALAARAGQS